MLTLKLYPSEFFTLISTLREFTGLSHQPALRKQRVGTLVMLAYLRSWSSERLYNWKHRKATKAYALKLPVAVAKALYDELQVRRMLRFPMQLLLDKLDVAIVNYHGPYAGPHVLGELINQ